MAETRNADHIGGLLDAILHGSLGLGGDDFLIGGFSVRRAIAELTTLRTALAKARADGIEEAAKCLDKQADLCAHVTTEQMFKLLAEAIRSLKEPDNAP